LLDPGAVFDTGYDEFLEKIGWEDEGHGNGKGNGAQKRPTARNNHNEKKQRDKAERREKARLEKLEEQIIKSETDLKSTTNKWCPKPIATILLSCANCRRKSVR